MSELITKLVQRTSDNRKLGLIAALKAAMFFIYFIIIAVEKII